MVELQCAFLVDFLVSQVDKERGIHLQQLYSDLKENRMNKDRFYGRIKGLVGEPLVKAALAKVTPLQAATQLVDIKGAPETKERASGDAAASSGSAFHSIDNSVMAKGSSPLKPLAVKEHKSNTTASLLNGNAQKCSEVAEKQNGSSFHSMDSSAMMRSSTPSKPLMVECTSSATASLLSRNMQESSEVTEKQSGSTLHSMHRSTMVRNSISMQPFTVKEHASDATTSLFSTVKDGKGKGAISQPMKFRNPGYWSLKPMTNDTESTTLVSSASSLTGIQTKAKALQKRASKSTLDHETLLLPSKRQKVSDADASESYGQDVVALSGIDVAKEEELLLSGNREGRQSLRMPGRIEQEREEEWLILQRAPLQQKLTQIISRYGIKRIAEDVECCLSLSVEERMQGLIRSIIKMSKQRVDSEKSRHQTVVTSDINNRIKSDSVHKSYSQHLVAAINHVPNDDLTENRVEEQRPRNEANEMQKVMRTAANAAARAALGGDELFSKWKQTQEQRKGLFSLATSQPNKDVSHISSQMHGRTAKVGQRLQAEGKKDSDDQTKLSRTRNRMQQETSVSRPKIRERSLSVRDVAAALERDLQLSKSSILLRLYENMYK